MIAPFFSLVFITVFLPFVLGRSDHRQRDISPLSSSTIKQISNSAPSPWTGVSDGHMERLLIPRPAGSENNTKVREYIKEVFDKLDWHVEEDTFTSSTPIGDVSFTNLIFTFDPSAPRKLLLTAHHDSLYAAEAPMNQFVGATDSAAPCAMLLDLAEFITPHLRARKQRQLDGELEDDEDEAIETTLQVVFFDGEEAFKSWTDTDSTYGSRHLAEKWESQYLEPAHPLVVRRMSPNPTVLATIDHLVLFDLLGASNPRILNTYQETAWLFDMMKDADSRLREANLVQNDGEEWFQKSTRGFRIEDDHVPFNRRGVSVLHVIANPFPSHWHNIGDDASILDLPTLHRWNLIVRIFTMEYLNLDLARPSTRTIDELV